MKRRSWVISLAVWWSLAATCFAAPEEKIAGPRLVMQERFFNFQEVQEGEVIEHGYVILETDEWGAKDVIEVVETHIAKADPHAENGRENDDTKDDECGREDQRPGQTRLSSLK